MRRSLVALSIFSCVGLVACEDGPYQPYQPSPDGAGNNWNDGKTPPAVGGATQPFAAGNGNGSGTNKQEICNAPVQAKRWKTMVSNGTPLVPPFGGGGLDMAGTPGTLAACAAPGATTPCPGALTPPGGNETWAGLTVENAEAINCQGVAEGDQFGDGTQVVQWGDNGEVWADYIVSSRKVDFMTFWPGYEGYTTFTSKDGKDTFQLQINTSTGSVTKNGQFYQIDWPAPIGPVCPAVWTPTTKCFAKEATEIYNALAATFAPSLPQDPNCTASGTCQYGNFGDLGGMFFPPIGIFFWANHTQSAAQPVPSTFNRVDIYLTKTLGFSLANPFLKLDAVGPTATAGNVGGPQDCTLQFGMTYQDLLANCVQTTGNAAKNVTELAKLIGGLTHGPEAFHFDVQGVDVNFQSTTLAATSILSDKDRPAMTDIVTDFDTDQNTLGKTLNDRVGNVVTGPRDTHGAGLVYLEYARIVQDALNGYIAAGQVVGVAPTAANQHPLGDPLCTTGVDPMALNFPAGCTGFEGITTTAPVDANPLTDPFVANRMGKNAWLINPTLALGLKPGHPAIAFCLDANGDIMTGYNFCNAPQGAQGDLFATSFARILQVLGQGQISNLPPDARDVRFFWRAWVKAATKYFMATGESKETVAGVHGEIVDPNNLYFDSIGAGQFEIGEYIDRRFASKTQHPTDITITADVKNGIMNDYDFAQTLLRGEKAVYTAMTEHQADGLGVETNAVITNTFGSPVLFTGWAPSSMGKSAYYCATNLDPNNCDGQLPPNDGVNILLDDIGRPLLSAYPGAFAGAATAFTLGNVPITVKQTFPGIAQALVDIPLTSNPYDPSSTALGVYETLIPWAPSQPGIGFPIAINGQIEKFVQTEQMDFSGQEITAQIDYTLVIDPATMKPVVDPKTMKPTGALMFNAVESTDFLGELFICQDPNTKDLLHVRMYDTAETILVWLEQHPGTYDSCGMIVRYSPYDNYPDYITSLANGVLVDITQGGGFGRVVGATLFVPGQ